MRGVWRELALEAFVSLKLQGRRSLLALLGVMIGSASIVALLSFSHIAHAEVMRRFEALGADTVQLISDPTGQQWMDHRLFSRQFSEEPDIRVAVPLSVTRDSVGANGQAESASIVATTQDGFEWLSPGMAAGRGLASGDGCNGAAVLGSALAKTLGAGVGDVVFIGGYGYRTVGLLAPADPMGVLPVSPDEAVLIGLGCVGRVMPRSGYSHILARVAVGTDPVVWADGIKQRLQSAGLNPEVTTAQQIMAAMKGQMSLMSAILVAIGSVSLLVGGVGVMNVMLMSVMERRREIGLRAAIGATPAEIVFIFVVEAVVLSLGGGLLGSLAGIGLTALGCVFLPVSFVFAPSVLVWGTGVAGAVGLLFGIHPAVAAARILPVEALRAD